MKSGRRHGQHHIGKNDARQEIGLVTFDQAVRGLTPHVGAGLVVRHNDFGGATTQFAIVELHREFKSVSNIDAQASAGDTWHLAGGRCRELLEQKLLPLVRYYAYVQVAQTEQNLWDEYQVLGEQFKQFAMRKVLDASQIYPVFRELFKKEGVDA